MPGALNRAGVLGRIRTCGLSVRSAALYPLSYEDGLPGIPQAGKIIARFPDPVNVAWRFGPALGDSPSGEPLMSKSMDPFAFTFDIAITPG